MNLAFLDWFIVALVLALLIGGVLFTKRFMRSVADFLAAGRTAGRYVISMSQGMAMLGAITIVGMLEMNYVAGFTLRWWELSNAIVIVAITVSGWVVYRFRQTRALTMAQFFEQRYSKKFRVFAGLIAFLSGIINFGIFPAVGARFFIYFCGLPDSFNLLGLDISTFAFTMIVLLSIALFFVFVGGQIAVIITDFIQGILVNAVFVVIIIYFLFEFDFDTIYTAMQTAPENASLINPFKTGHTEDFNFWYFLIGLIGLIYGKLSWQGTQAYNSSAKSAHEAKMGEVLGNWRNIPQWSLFLVFVPIVIYTVVNHPEFTSVMGNVNPTLDGLESDTLVNQLRIPIILTQILPKGILGAFAAIMLAAFISTHDTYLHSWGSIFIQDVVMPFRKKPFKPKQHLKALRLSILGVAIFIFIFSLIFRQSQYIFLFFAITGAIFTGGSGAVIIGGLYWKKGTTAAAWSALITGSVIAVGGIVIHQLWNDFFINGQMFWGLAMAVSTLTYIGVSYATSKSDFNMDKLLHKGKYEIKEDSETVYEVPTKGWRVLGMGKEFTKGDKLVYIMTYGWTILWTAIFVIGTIYNLTYDVADTAWMEYWKYYVYINTGVSILVIVWFLFGGAKDLKSMFSRLDKMKREDEDDGFVTK